MNLQELATGSDRIVSASTRLLDVYQEAFILNSLLASRDFKVDIAAMVFPDGQGGTITDADTPIPALKGRTVNEIEQALFGVEKFCEVLEATPQDTITGYNGLARALRVSKLS